MGEFSLLVENAKMNLLRNGAIGRRFQFTFGIFFVLSRSRMLPLRGKTHSEKMSMKNQKWIQMKKKSFTALRSLELYFSLKLTDIDSSIVHAVRSSQSAYLHTQATDDDNENELKIIFLPRETIFSFFFMLPLFPPVSILSWLVAHCVRFSLFFLQLLGSQHRKNFCCNEVNRNATRENKHTHSARTSTANEKMN